MGTRGHSEYFVKENIHIWGSPPNQWCITPKKNSILSKDFVLLCVVKKGKRNGVVWSLLMAWQILVVDSLCQKYVYSFCKKMYIHLFLIFFSSSTSHLPLPANRYLCGLVLLIDWVVTIWYWEMNSFPPNMPPHVVPLMSRSICNIYICGSTLRWMWFSLWWIHATFDC